MPASEHWIRDANRLTPQGWFASSLPILVVSVLVCLGAANVASRSAWREVEDGVLWAARAEGVVAAEIAPGTPAAAVGLQRGDLLVAIDDTPDGRAVRRRRGAARRRARVHAALHGDAPGLARRGGPARRAGSGTSGRALLRARGGRRSSRCSSAARCGCAVRAIRRRSTSCGSRSRSSACSRSRSAAGWIGWTGCSTGPTSSPSWPCRRSSWTSRWSFPSGAVARRAAGSIASYRSSRTRRPSCSAWRAWWRWRAARPMRPSSCASARRSIVWSSSTWPSASSAVCWC